MKPTDMILIFILIMIILIGTTMYLFKSNIHLKVDGEKVTTTEEQPPPVPGDNGSGGSEENPPSPPG